MKHYKLVKRTKQQGHTKVIEYVIKKRVPHYFFWEKWVDKWLNGNVVEQFVYYEGGLNAAIKKCDELNNKAAPIEITEEDYVDKTDRLMGKAGFVRREDVPSRLPVSDEEIIDIERSRAGMFEGEIDEEEIGLSPRDDDFHTRYVQWIDKILEK